MGNPPQEAEGESGSWDVDPVAVEIGIARFRLSANCGAEPPLLAASLNSGVDFTLGASSQPPVWALTSAASTPSAAP